MGSDKKLLSAVFIVSLSILIFELSLMRYFSVLLYPSMAFVGITVAMFGLTMGGLIVFLLPKFFLSGKKSALYSALIIMGSCLVYLEYTMPVFDPGKGLESVLGLFLLTSVPFLAGSIFLTIIFSNYINMMGKIYASDLIGAGMGVAVSIFLMNNLDLGEIVGITAMLTFLSFVLISTGKKFFTLALVLFISATGFALYDIYDTKPDLLYTKMGQEKNLIFYKSNSFSRISAKNMPINDVPYSFSPKFTSVPYPGEQIGIAIDADAYTPVMEFNGDIRSAKFLTHDLAAAAYSVSDKGEVLIIGPGGGRDILIALVYGNSVKGVDVNPIIINNLMKGQLKEFTGNLYGRPDVNVTVAEGRSFIQKDGARYSVINLSLVDTWASTTAGNMALVEGYLYTTEAFEEYLGHLKPGGILTISRWAVDGDRLVPLFYEASKKAGISDASSNTIIMSRIKDGEPFLNNYLFSITPFTPAQITRATSFAKDNGFEVIYAPGMPEGTFHANLFDSAEKGNYQEYENNMKPVYDNDPFFFMRTPLEKIFTNTLEKNQMSPGGDSGLVIAMILSVLFATATLILPLIFSFHSLVSERRKGTMIKHMIYFGLLGASFMMLEIALIQKFILYLEYPVYSYSVVLTTILIFSGLGSYISPKIAGINAKFIKLSLAIALLLIVTGLLTSYLFNNTLGWPIVSKILIAVLLNGPVALLMGTLMPLGFARLNDDNMKHLLPWCWAFNGSFSILASVFSMVLAIAYGFTTVLALGAVGYLIAGYVYSKKA